MNKRIILTASLLGLLSVVLGAFGAHGLGEKISSEQLDHWKTGVHYQFYHVLAMLFLATFSRARNGLIQLAYISFTIGILLFSGSLYLLSTQTLTGISASYLGPVTPIGGVFLIIGWLSLLIATIRHK